MTLKPALALLLCLPPAFSQTPLLTASPTSITCAAPYLGGPSAPQTLLVLRNPTGAGTPFRIDIDGGTTDTPAPAWISVTPSTGSTPARLAIRCNAGQLGANYYTARVRVVPVQSSQPPINIPVTFEVQDLPPNLEVSPNILKYVWRQGQGAVIRQSFLMRNAGGGGPIGFRALLNSGNNFIRAFSVVQPTATTPGRLDVTVDGAGLAPGVYKGEFAILSSLPDQTVPLTLLVTPSSPNMEVYPAALQFDQLERSGTPPSRNLFLINNGGTPLTYNVDIQTGLNFLGVGSGQGTIAPGGIQQIAVIINSNNLNAGNYYGLLRITADGANNGPLFVPVVLAVRATTTSDATVVSPSGLVFIATPNQLSQSTVVRVFASSPRTVTVYTGTSSDDGAGWLSVSPNSGQASATASAQFNVSINASSLKPGVYTGILNAQVGPSDVRNTNITVIVPKIAGVNSAAAEAGPSLAGCTPTRLTTTSTGLINNFASPAGWPIPIGIRVTDDCGDPANDAQVTVQFSSGDPALVLRNTNPTTGTFTGTWTPRRNTAQVTVRATATSGALTPAVAELSGGISPNVVPQLAENGTLNNLNPRIGDPLAPGAVVAIFGSGLAGQTTSPGIVPLPQSFGGTTVVVNGQPAPLYFVSPDQINAQLPTDLPPNKQVQIFVSANGAITVPDLINTTPSNPGVAAFADGRVIAQHGADFRLITPQDPADKNEPIIVYLAGMGATTPAAATGQLSPFAPAVSQPTVTLDGRPCELFYAGLTPLAIGLYQINLRVPADSRSGDLQLVVRQNNVEANRATLPVR